MRPYGIGGKPLPRNAEAESAVLGALILDSPTKEVALELLQPDDFSTGINHCIYACLRRMIREGVHPDLVLVRDTLGLEGEDAAYLARLIDGVPRIINVGHYARIVKQKSLLRQNVNLVYQVLELVVSANGNGDEVLKQIAEMLSAHLRDEVGQKRILRFMSGTELAATTEETIPWIVRGYVAQGAITELGAKVKAGKTTWAMVLARAVLDGAQFLGEPTLKTTVVYLSEQPKTSLRQSLHRAGLLTRNDFFVLTFTETKGLPWAEVAHAAREECKRRGATLLVIDTLSQFAGLVGDSENNAGDALVAMQPLQQAAADGIGVIVVRHGRKSGGEVGDSGRGSSAFAGAADVVLFLGRPEGKCRKTIRLIEGLSRFSETPTELLIELTEDGYIALGDPKEAAVREAKSVILELAAKIDEEAMTLPELIEGAGISRSTAQRAVEELVAEKQLGRIGEGKKGNPFRYSVTK